jgi:hypothetical protein
MDPKWLQLHACHITEGLQGCLAGAVAGGERERQPTHDAGHGEDSASPLLDHARRDNLDHPHNTENIRLHHVIHLRHVGLQQRAVQSDACATTELLLSMELGSNEINLSIVSFN